ncbi:helix-turn-helix transcriptional regulator [Nitratireductor aquimarinus]|uniref:helix-turn-helix transcriptional regulator n=1 Tax=Alphaproteobacteria TaxID=28211 RepID=UPI0019D3D7FF|nr:MULTISPECIES: helix-turn-helix transcriptional regulator [Alphaproteobacteria]MBN7759475.1 helix-turn-helix transcriptional regulator [Nitratireductor aquimarinus]MBY6001764.1 helix-turn-helix transcriptional regulator [Tritonibacter mobilis]MBY6024050.1 helix-turn-helix transcriptional regulator [Nitratireductor sp. DP7N14-4]MCV0348488.1 helix-turn-helix transcriptional regulator [Nitratireductor sp.]
MKLETYLSERDMKPSAFAVEIGVAPSTITRILRGERSPGLDLVMRILRATDGKVSVEDWYNAETAA